MNYFDIIIICILSFGFIKGFLKGFFNEVSSFIGFFIGLIGATMFSENLSNLILKIIDLDLKILNIISFIFLFIVITILFSLIGKSLTKLMKFASLGTINRLFGGIFSFGKYLVILSFIVLLINYINTLFSISLISKDSLNESTLFTFLQSVGDRLFYLLDNQMMITL
ncbi:MAG: CvpA family protein [Flavobacteriaceae bacterium]